jgi:ribosomal protein S18 acetylase RimI-like enzyme
MAGAVSIRRGRPEDIGQVLELWARAGASPRLTDAPEVLAQLLESTQSILLLADIDGQLAGTVIGGWDGWRGNIYRLAVAPGYRRRGLARLLVAEADRSLHRMGARRITALVEGDHPWATDFWDSLAASGYRYDEGMRRYVKTL